MDENDPIRARAYQIWEAEGRPEGRDAEHWAQARQELQQGGASSEDASVTDSHEEPSLLSENEASDVGGPDTESRFSEDG